jgi:hypothetical protein
MWSINVFLTSGVGICSMLSQYRGFFSRINYKFTSCFHFEWNLTGRRCRLCNPEFYRSRNDELCENYKSATNNSVITFINCFRYKPHNSCTTENGLIQWKTGAKDAGNVRLRKMTTCIPNGMRYVSQYCAYRPTINAARMNSTPTGR